MTYMLESYSVLELMLTAGWLKEDIVLGISETEIDLTRYRRNLECAEYKELESAVILQLEDRTALTL
jgi:hypothetical protein